MCREIGALAIIDDNISYVTSCAYAEPPALRPGGVGIIFGCYRWNKERRETEETAGAAARPAGARIVRGSTWDEVRRILLTLLPPDA